MDYEDAYPMEEEVSMIGMFLGYFFIRKCMWSTPNTIRSNAASLKKFYICMMEAGKIENADYDYVCESIKEGMPEWIADCEQYNDPDAPNPFAFF